MGDEVDLDALLESALDDFNKEPEPVPRVRKVETKEEKKEDIFGDENLDEMLKDPMKALTNLLSDPKMKEEFERDFGSMMKDLGNEEQSSSGEFSFDNFQKELENLAKNFDSANTSNPPPSSIPTPESTEEAKDNLAATLENLMNSAKDLKGEDIGEESIMEMFKNIEQNPELSTMMETLMEKFMSKEVLYESLTELQTKFSEWLEKKESSLSEEKIAEYRAQLESIGRVLAIYDANENDESTVAEAEELMRQMETVGTLPEEVLNELSGKPGDAPCTIM